MDPLDIMLNKNQVVPYFTPILSADTQSVIGYEVEAFWHDEGEKRNLNWFFADHDIPSDYRIELEDDLHEKATQYYLSKDGHNQLLFFHYNVKLLKKNGAEVLFERLEQMKAAGLPFEKLYFIIGFDHGVEELLAVKHTLVYLQSLGAHIAIDADSTTAHQLEFISQLRPNVIRVNCSFLEENMLPGMYRDIHQPLALLARKIGATLLFDQVESFSQLNYAWRSGGRYYQGPYLQKGSSEFIERKACKEKLMKDMNHFILYERKKMEAQFELSNSLTHELKYALKAVEQAETFDSVVLRIAKALNSYTFRVYICNDDGIQESSNAEKTSDGDWVLIKESRAKNWSWRPYFLENIVRMNVEKKGILSDLYTDIERDEQIRTYSYPLNSNQYVFIDIPYDYLFEQDDLL